MQKNKTQQGFILPVVLMFMHIYALLGVAALESGLLNSKIIIQQQMERAAINEAKVLLRRVEIILNEYIPPCVIPVTPLNQLKNKTSAWWNDFSCVGMVGQFHYYYVLESLGKDFCVTVIDKNEGIADYYRITVWIKSNDETENVLLQSTVVKASPEAGPCNEKRRMVYAGQQSLIVV